MAEQKPYKYVQALMPREEVDELDRYIQKEKESGRDVSKNDLIRELILKEIRKDAKPL